MFYKMNPAILSKTSRYYSVIGWTHLRKTVGTCRNKGLIFRKQKLLYKKELRIVREQ